MSDDDTVTLTLRRQDAEALITAAPPATSPMRLVMNVSQIALLTALEKALYEGPA